MVLESLAHRIALLKILRNPASWRLPVYILQGGVCPSRQQVHGDIDELTDYCAVEGGLPLGILNADYTTHVAQHMRVHARKPIDPV
eukprot:COSAG05_NODE_1242_length_5418_cov_8.384471_4_plen_86_part_00